MRLSISCPIIIPPDTACETFITVARSRSSLGARMVLVGDYESFRRFVFDVETAPDFLIIDGVTLAQGEVGKPLTLNLELSTFYRVPANGS